MSMKFSLTHKVVGCLLLISLVQKVSCSEVWVGITQNRLMAWIEGERLDLDGSFTLRGLTINRQEKSHWETRVGSSLFYWKGNRKGVLLKLGSEYNWVGVKVNNSYHIASTSRLSLVKTNLEIRLSENWGIFADSRVLSIHNVSFLKFGEDFNQFNFDLSNNAIGIKVRF